MSARRVVVAGGGGFVGSHLCEALVARGDEVVVLDSFVTGERQNLDALAGRPEVTVVEADVTSPFEVPGKVDAVLNLASPASPADYQAHPLLTLRTRQRRHRAAARPGACPRRPLPARFDERGLRRAAGAPAGRGVLGQREPCRAAQHVRRGQALRRGVHDGVRPRVRRRRAHRPDLQHLWAPPATGRRARGVELHRAGAAGRAAHHLRGRQPDPQLLLRERRGRRPPGAARR